MKRFRTAFRIAALVFCVPMMILFLNCEPKSEPEPSGTDQPSSEAVVPDTEEGQAEPDTIEVVPEEGGATPSGGAESGDNSMDIPVAERGQPEADTIEVTPGGGGTTPR